MACRHARSTCARRRHGRSEVWDSGPGPAPAEFEQVFTPFYRRRDSSSTSTGNGLGLSLVRQIARAMAATRIAGRWTMVAAASWSRWPERLGAGIRARKVEAAPFYGSDTRITVAPIAGSFKLDCVSVQSGDSLLEKITLHRLSLLLLVAPLGGAGLSAGLSDLTNQDQLEVQRDSAPAPPARLASSGFRRISK